MNYETVSNLMTCYVLIRVALFFHILYVISKDYLVGIFFRKCRLPPRARGHVTAWERACVNGFDLLM